MSRFSALRILALCVAQSIDCQHASSETLGTSTATTEDNVAMLQSVTNTRSSSNRGMSDTDMSFLFDYDDQGVPSMPDFHKMSTAKEDNHVHHDHHGSLHMPNFHKMQATNHEVEAKSKPTSHIHHGVLHLPHLPHVPHVPHSHNMAHHMLVAKEGAMTTTDVEADADASAGVVTEVAGTEVDVSVEESDADVATTEDGSAELLASVEQSSSEENSEGSAGANKDSTDVDSGANAKINTEAKVTSNSEADVVVGAGLDASAEESSSMVNSDESDAEVDATVQVTTDVEVDAAVTEDAGVVLDTNAEETSINSDSEGSNVDYDHSTEVDSNAAAEDNAAVLVTADADALAAFDIGVDASAQESSSEGDSEGSGIAYDDGAEVDIGVNAEFDTADLVMTYIAANAAAAKYADARQGGDGAEP